MSKTPMALAYEIARDPLAHSATPSITWRQCLKLAWAIVKGDRSRQAMLYARQVVSEPREYGLSDSVEWSFCMHVGWQIAKGEPWAMLDEPAEVRPEPMSVAAAVRANRYGERRGETLAGVLACREA